MLPRSVTNILLWFKLYVITADHDNGATAHGPSPQTG